MITYHREEKTDKIFNVENSRLEIILKTTTTTELFSHPKERNKGILAKIVTVELPGLIS